MGVLHLGPSFAFFPSLTLYSPPEIFSGQVNQPVRYLHSCPWLASLIKIYSIKYCESQVSGSWIFCQPKPCLQTDSGCKLVQSDRGYNLIMLIGTWFCYI